MKENITRKHENRVKETASDFSELKLPPLDQTLVSEAIPGLDLNVTTITFTDHSAGPTYTKSPLSYR